MSYSSNLTKQRILDCAKAEFLKKGFQAAQLQDIVKAAKVTTGAVYRHFESKEGLFLALVEDVYSYTIKFMEAVEPFDPANLAQVLENDSLESSLQQTMAYVDYMYEHLEEFQLLLKYSQGSRVGNFIEEVAERYTKQNETFIEAAWQAGYIRERPSELEVHILTHGYITAICECILHDVPYEKVESYIHNILKFQHYGWYGILGLPIK